MKDNMFQWMLIAGISGTILAINDYQWITSEYINLFKFLGIYGFCFLFVMFSWEKSK